AEPDDVDRLAVADRTQLELRSRQTRNAEDVAAPGEEVAGPRFERAAARRFGKRADHERPFGTRLFRAALDAALEDCESRARAERPRGEGENRDDRVTTHVLPPSIDSGWSENSSAAPPWRRRRSASHRGRGGSRPGRVGRGAPRSGPAPPRGRAM